MEKIQLQLLSIVTDLVSAVTRLNIAVHMIAWETENDNAKSVLKNVDEPIDAVAEKMQNIINMLAQNE